MGKIKLMLGIIAIVISIAAIYFVLGSESALVTQPKGMIAHSELKLMIINVIIMLLIIIPTLIILLFVVWKYRANNKSTQHAPEETYGAFKQLILWIIPCVFVAVMAIITWNETHKLDPYQPIKSDIKPLTIQVVAIDWKWLFIYPEQGIATLNYVQFPERTPISFSLAADGSPMNSFWIPQLSGQIYCMSGMVTPLHVMADGPGVYRGKAAEINGDGYASMTFVAQSTSQSDFESWVAQVKKSPLKLTETTYNKLLIPSQNDPVSLYSDVDKDLFNNLVMKYMHPPHHN